MRCSTPLLGFCAYSGTGKTTLIEMLIPKLIANHLKIGFIKHAHHDFHIDQEQKDSYRLRQAGASQLVISSRFRHAYIHETPDEECNFTKILTKFDHEQLDLILVEGFKQVKFPKIELHRPALNYPLLYPTDPNIIAIAYDESLINPPSIPDIMQIDLNNIEQILNFILQWHKEQVQIKGYPSEPYIEYRDSQLTVDQAVEQVLKQIHPNPFKECHNLPIAQSLGEVVAKDIASRINVPQHTNSAMDGYAIHYQTETVQKDTQRQPTLYKLVGQVLAGENYEGELKVGEAIQIMTGAPVPKNTNTIVPIEDAFISFDLENPDQKMIHFGGNSITLGQHVRQAGEDITIGDLMINKGDKIKPVHLGLLSSIGLAEVPVMKPITVAIFSSGNEIQAPGTPLKKNAIYDSNRFILIGLLKQNGCNVIDLGIIKDDLSMLEDSLLLAACQADLILSSGGVSVGEADFIKEALQRQGTVNFWKIKIRPGRPLAFGHIHLSQDKLDTFRSNQKIDQSIFDMAQRRLNAPTNTPNQTKIDIPFFGLPGNPVAVFISFILFVAPTISKMQGRRKNTIRKQKAFASHPMRSKLNRTDYLRGICVQDNNGFLNVIETGQQGSGILSSVNDSNCLIELLPEQQDVSKGELVNVIWLPSNSHW